MSESTLIRPGQINDLEKLNEIYNYYVIHSHITFDIDTISLNESETWLRKFSTSGPYRLFVAEAERSVVGFSSSSILRPRAAYSTSVETSVYVDPLHIGRGIGYRLYQTLLAALEKESGVHRAFAGIALPNENSLMLHQRLDFQFIGIFHQVGYKFGRFWDVAWYERDVSAAEYPTNR
jgi:phosphinothricin acetyltransferase